MIKPLTKEYIILHSLDIIHRGDEYTTGYTGWKEPVGYSGKTVGYLLAVLGPNGKMRRRVSRKKIKRKVFKAWETNAN